MLVKGQAEVIVGAGKEDAMSTDGRFGCGVNFIDDYIERVYTGRKKRFSGVCNSV